jgi:DNA-binding transcriptional LysR family regulator
MDWNDLRLVLAVNDQGGMLGAAEALGVHVTTVSRRIKQIEGERQIRLFEKYRHGVVLTPAGADVVETARRMQGLTHDLDARLDGRDAALSGTIRVTAVGTLYRHWMPDLAEFQRRYPDIELELHSGLGMANLTQRQADVAIRIASEVPGHLIGARLAPVKHALYASHDFMQRVGPDADVDDLPWVSYDLAVFRGLDQYLDAYHPHARVHMRVPRIDMLLTALEGGAGVSSLQCIAGDRSPLLRRVGDIRGGWDDYHLWVLTHPQLRGTGRIRVFMRWVRGLVERDRALLAGEAG